MQPMREQTSSADAVKRVLTTAGITGAALTLSAAAALPAFACHGGGSDQSKQGQSSHQSKSGDDHATKTSSDSDDSKTGDQDSGDQDKSDSQHGDKSQHGNKSQHGDKSQGGDNDGHNPPGNNGTVKIHQTAGDSSPHNQPHVQCSFYVSFFGFDANQTMDVSFTGQAPTGKGVAIPVSTTTSKTSTTDAGGAGNDYDGDLGVFDASNMDLSVLGAPAKQGYHIKLDVATHEPGGHKYKVFWFTPCSSTPGGSTGGTTGGDTGGTTGGGTTGGTTGGETGGTTGGSTGGTTGGTTPEVGGTGATTGSSGGQGATVLGETFTKGTTSGAPAGAQVLGESASRGGSSGLAALPFTGAEVGAMSALGLAAVGGGAALTVAGRRRRRAASRA